MRILNITFYVAAFCLSIGNVLSQSGALSVTATPDEIGCEANVTIYSNVPVWVYEEKIFEEDGGSETDCYEKTWRATNYYKINDRYYSMGGYTNGMTITVDGALGPGSSSSIFDLSVRSEPCDEGFQPISNALSFVGYITVKVVDQPSSILEVTALIETGTVVEYTEFDFEGRLPCIDDPKAIVSYWVYVNGKYYRLSSYNDQSSVTVNSAFGSGRSSLDVSPQTFMCEDGTTRTVSNTVTTQRSGVNVRFTDFDDGTNVYTWSNGLGEGRVKEVSPGVTTTYTVTTTVNGVTYTGSVTVEVIGAHTANAGPDDDICGRSYTLGAIVTDSETGTWSVVSGPGNVSFSDINSPVSGINVTELGTYQLQWETNIPGNCPSSIDFVNLNFIEIEFDISVENACPAIGDPVVLNIVQYQAGLTYEIDWGDGTTESTQLARIEHFYSVGSHSITVSASQNGCSLTKDSEDIIVTRCFSHAVKIEAGNGRFKMNRYNGSIAFERDECGIDIDFDCLLGPSETIPRVINASAITLSDEWNYDGQNLAAVAGNEYDRATRGKWRAKSTHTYKTDDIVRDKNLNTGSFNLELFNWKHPQSVKPDWVRASTVSRYSPHGEGLEEVNALDIATTVKFGYGNSVPYLTAQNASFQSVLFDAFEKGTGIPESGVLLETGVYRDDEFSHSGTWSLSMANGATITLPNMSMTNEVNQLRLYAWVKGTGTIDINGTNVVPVSQPLGLQQSDWTLLVTLVEVTNKADFEININYTNSLGQSLYLDDLRVQPLDSEMTCYVYDRNTLRLLTILDDRHYGLYYQYNEEGKLTRKQIETERGVKTIQETFYNGYQND